MDLFKKKFKVRVRHYDDNAYIIQYAYYTLIPIYWSIKRLWSWPYDVTIDPEWRLEIFSRHLGAESFASKFKTIQDIRNYYAPLKEKFLDLQRQKEEWYRKERLRKKDIPYKTKQII